MSTLNRGLPLASIAAALILVVLGQGCFLLDRADALPAGSVVGVVQRADGSAAAGAAVSFPVLRLDARADGDGRFRVTGLPVGAHALTAIIDVDADGVADEGALAVVVIRPAGGSGVALGTDIGRVLLAPTGSLSGRTVDEAGTPIGAASVAVWRTAELSPDGVETVVVDLAAEQLVESAPDGTFLIRGLIAGPVFLAGFDSVANIATRAGAPSPAEVPPGDEEAVGDLRLDPVEGTRNALVTLARVEPDPVEIRIAPTGRAPPAEVTASFTGARSFILAVPIGVWDVYLKSGTRSTILLAQVAPPPGPETVSWGIAELVDRGAVCGDGILSPGEVCDDGAGNSDTRGDACRTTCVLPTCGDGATDTGEGCDDGAANSDTGADACRTSCQPAACGDGIVDAGEACDDAAANSDTAADACRTTCQRAGCGDGVVDNAEACDDGAANSDTGADACRTTCEAAACGDGVIDAGEGCDDGDANVALPCTPSGTTSCSVCLDTCAPFSADPEADFVVKVVSGNGWGTVPLAGVALTIGGRTALTDASGVARLRALAPVGGGLAGIGDNRDPAFADRAFSRVTRPLAAGIAHDAVIDLGTVAVTEGCAIDLAGQVGAGISDFCGFLNVRDVSVAPGAASMLRPGTATPLVDEPWTLRVTSAASLSFGDGGSLTGFPPLITDDGRRLRCRDLYDIRVDDADFATDLQNAPVMVLGAGPIGNRTFERPFRFDDAIGAFVDQFDIAVDPTGQQFLLVEEGTWCYGEAQAPDGCLLVSTDPAAAIAEPLTVELTWDSLGSSRTTVVVPPGGAACAPVFSNSFINATTLTSDGRRGSGGSGEVFFNAQACANEPGCGTLVLTFDEGPSDGCVALTAEVDDGTGTGTITPFVGDLIFGEPSEGTIYRGRIAVDGTSQCLVVPNFITDLEWTTGGDVSQCSVPGRLVASTSRLFNPDPSIGAPTCADPGACDTSLGTTSFTCFLP